MEVELLEQFFLDAGADAVAEQRAVGHDDGGAARLAGAAPELAHDELKEEQRGLGGLLVVGEVAEDAALFLAAEGRVGQDDVDAVLVADLRELESEGVAGIDAAARRARAAAGSSGEQIGQRLRPRRRRATRF